MCRKGTTLKTHSTPKEVHMKTTLFAEVPWSLTPTSGHFNFVKIDMTQGQGQQSKRTGRNQCALLLEKSVQILKH